MTASAIALVLGSALLMALTTGVFIGSYTLIDARGASETSGLGFFSASALIAALVVMATGRVSLDRLRTAGRYGVTVGLMSAGAYGLVLLAYTRADAASVATLRSTSILFGLALVPRTLSRPLIGGAVLLVVGSVMVTA